MATISSHTLNGTDGTHAAGIVVSLYCICEDKAVVLFNETMDEGGRLKSEIPDREIDPDADYELVFETGAFWKARTLSSNGVQIMKQVRLRFNMPDPAGSYHLPIIISPNSYSVWWSS